METQTKLTKLLNSTDIANLNRSDISISDKVGDNSKKFSFSKEAAKSLLDMHGVNIIVGSLEMLFDGKNVTICNDIIEKCDEDGQTEYVITYDEN